MLIDLPFEVLVRGIPVSAQGSARSRASWQAAVREACRASLPEDWFAHGDPVSVILFHFPDGPMAGDLDNVAKPILDALKGLVFLDDGLVRRLLVRSFEGVTSDSFPRLTDTLTLGVAGPRPVTYISCSSDFSMDRL